MPFIVDDVAPNDEVVTRTFDILGQPAEISYYRNRMTLDSGKGVTGTGEEIAMGVAKMTCALVAEWDLEGPVKRADGTIVVESGEPVPVDPDVVRHFPYRLVKAINDAIGNAESDAGNAPKRPRR